MRYVSLSIDYRCQGTNTPWKWYSERSLSTWTRRWITISFCPSSRKRGGLGLWRFRAETFESGPDGPESQKVIDGHSGTYLPTQSIRGSFRFLVFLFVTGGHNGLFIRLGTGGPFYRSHRNAMYAGKCQVLVLGNLHAVSVLTVSRESEGLGWKM